MIDTTPYVRTLDGKPVAVLGLGVSGLSVAKALKTGGARVVAWDDEDDKRNAAEKAGIEIADFIEGCLDGYAALIMAPGIPLHFPKPHPAVEKAREAGIEIIGDLEIFHRSLHGFKTVGITGTNGKSTTTALIAHVVKESGRNAAMGGNIGVPVFNLPLSGEGGIAVLEMSSYQIDLCPNFAPDIAVLLNITPDHIERHGSMESYIAAKERIFQGAGVAICAIDDPHTIGIYDKIVKAGMRTVIPVSVKKEMAGGVYVREGNLFDAIQGEAVNAGSLTGISTLPGTHNQQNICAAFAVCRTLGLTAEEILTHVKTYPGLSHRQFLARLINGIAYVNDSKATNADATARAVACYNNVYLIAGGRPKEGGLSGLEPYGDKIRHVFLIGEAMDDFAKWLQNMNIPHTKSGSLDIAVLEAHRMAQSERGQPGGAGTVLLSPACASWDQFENFAQRGTVFEALVKTLSEEVQG